MARTDIDIGMYRTCRRNGETVRRMIDCLIGAVSISHGVSVIHSDVDFEVLARQTDVMVHRPRS